MLLCQLDKQCDKIQRNSVETRAKSLRNSLDFKYIIGKYLLNPNFPTQIFSRTNPNKINISLNID